MTPRANRRPRRGHSRKLRMGQAGAGVGARACSPIPLRSPLGTERSELCPPKEPRYPCAHTCALAHVVPDRLGLSDRGADGGGRRHRDLVGDIARPRPATSHQIARQLSSSARAQRGQFPLRNHEAPSRAIVALTRKPQRETRWPPGGPAGSSAEMPAVSLSRQAETSTLLSRPSCSAR